MKFTFFKTHFWGFMTLFRKGRGEKVMFGFMFVSVLTNNSMVYTNFETENSNNFIDLGAHPHFNNTKDFVKSLNVYLFLYIELMSL